MPIVKERGKPVVFDFRGQTPISVSEVLEICEKWGAFDSTTQRYRLKAYHSDDMPNGLLIIARPVDVKICVEAYFGKTGFLSRTLSAYPKFTPRE